MHPCEEKKDGCRDFLTLPRTKSLNAVKMWKKILIMQVKLLLIPLYTGYTVTLVPWNDYARDIRDIIPYY